MANALQEWLHARFARVGVWDVLGELAGMRETQRVDVLRPHEEQKVPASRRNDPTSVQGIRGRLDDALDLLTLGEIAAQMCELCAKDAVDGVPADALGHLRELTASQAFRRYVEAYQFAGVRFLVAREPKLRGAAVAPVMGVVTVTHADGAVMNWTSLPLVTPPSLQITPERVVDLLRAIAVSPAPQTPERAALDFLEGFDIFSGVERSSAPSAITDDHQVRQMELWLRGLLPELGRRQADGQMLGTELSTNEDLERGRRFEEAATGLLCWAKARAEIYWDLREDRSLPTTLDEAVSLSRPERGWNCDTPTTARLALVDLYFLSRLLRAEVSPLGEVVYGPVSWLGLIGMRAALETRADSLAEMHLVKEVRLVEEVLRSVFGLVCELFHNGAELQAAADYKAAVKESVSWRANKDALCWRAVFDAELEAIARQRKLRDYGNPRGSNTQQSKCKDWSWPLREEGAPRELIGLCFSGGGIRSATFNLGVLEGLQELDMLRPVDYLSTVSGGGFVGGWLLGNVRRARYWLGSQAPWKDSIRHLREYSNYLAPKTGILSMDTWSLGGLWLRNTLLIQLLVLAWVLASFAGLYLTREAYEWMKAGVAGSCWPWSKQYWLLLILSLGSEAFVAAFIASSLKRLQDESWKWLQERVRFSAVVTWVGCALISTRVLAEVKQWVVVYGHGGNACELLHYSLNANEFTNYSKVLLLGLTSWPFVLLFTAIGLFTLAWISLQESDNELPKAANKEDLEGSRFALACFAAVLCTAVLHLLLSAMAYVALQPWVIFHRNMRGELFAFVFGPAAVVGSYSVVVLLLVGLIAKRSNEPQREWWTRYGAWILVSALMGMVFSGVVLGAPKVAAMIAASPWHKLKWTAIASWVATMAGGLFAGKSSKTSDQTKERSIPLEVLAQLGGLLFLVSFLMSSAWLLFEFFHAFSDSNATISRTITGTSLWLSGGTCAALVILGALFSSRFEINLFGLNQLYRNRLVRSYLGATRWMPGMRHPDAFTQFDFADDMPLTDLRQGAERYKDEFRGPFPVLNCSMNMGGSRDLSLHTRHSASFTFTPLHCGADREAIGYVDTKQYAGGDVGLGMAIAISGAAASPNMGYNTSPLVALLLSMFNVRLGWWIPNPGQKKWDERYLSSSIKYMFLDLLGIADDKSYCLNISDGGHFENMGLYEMVRRRCKLIILGDGECDEVMQFGGLANAIRLCATDFGARIEIDLSSLKLQKDGNSLQHAAIGTIQYANGSIGRLIYLKASVTGDEDATVAQYHASHPAFPHQTTANQFFTEDQFESYRRLGKHVVRQAFRGTSTGEHPVAAAERMADTLSPQSCSVENFVTQSEHLNELWERLRGLQGNSAGFLEELMGLRSATAGQLTPEVIAIGLEIFQFMENVYLDLRLDDFWEHPDNRGWAMLFMNWARSTRLRQVWRGNHRTFGVRFEYFCGRRLGLYRERPVLRVTPLPRD